MISIQEALKTASDQFKLTSESSQLDAEILLAHVLEKSRTYLYAYPEITLTREQAEQYRNLVHQRHLGTPIAYLTGIREFWSMPLKVTKDTLIPRPETELMVEITLDILHNQPHAHILDLGTGSGAIALALAREKPEWDISASDISIEALKIAKDNAISTGSPKIKFFHSDWFTKLPKKQYHAILSNPPYIRESDPHLLQGDVRFEPMNALVSGQNGLIALQYLIEMSHNYLLPGGRLILEHGHDQKLAIQTILNDIGYKNIHCWQDWQGNDRVSTGEWHTLSKV